MSKRSIVLIKVLVHVVCLAPFFWLLRCYASGTLEREPDPVAFITHFTGDWALWILVVSLAITPLRRISSRIGWLIRFRRLIGLYSFFYASLHLATYVFLFSGYDLPTALAGVRTGHLGVLVDQWREIWPSIRDDIRKRRFIQLGFAGWLILLALAATSPARVIRVMGGKPWQRLHRLVYAAAIAAVVHYWWMVKPGVRAPWKVTAVLATLFLVRIAYIVSRHTSKPRTVEATRS